MTQKLDELFGLLHHKKQVVNDDVKETVVQQLYDREVTDKSAKLLKALDKVQQLNRDLKKAENQKTEMFTEDGNCVKYQTKEQREGADKVKKELEKLTNNIEKALNGDWSNLQ